MGSGSGGFEPLFETKTAKRIALYRLYAASVFVGICLIWGYRASHVPRHGEEGRWVWVGTFAAEFWFGFYWFLNQSRRWNLVYRRPFKDRLSQRHENELPGVDVFVCTADPAVEPPIVVINTVLSVIAYDYPPDKLSVYLSDDAGSIVTYYALFEASRFAKHWIPFCKKLNVEPRSPAAYFASMSNQHDIKEPGKLATMKKLYKDMESRIETAVKLGRIPDEVQLNHKGFSLWRSHPSRHNHDTILQILIDGKDSNNTDIEGCLLPSLVYLAREKRPEYPHHFKAGAMNSLIRVSSNISNGKIILNVDCDMYSNSSGSMRDALCFFLDEKSGPSTAYVQFPQNFHNLTKNDIYYSTMKVFSEVELHGMDACGGPPYVGTGCFYRRDALCGKRFVGDSKINLNPENDIKRRENVYELEEESKHLASCTYKENTPWGKEIGVIYGLTENIITGLSVQFRGWKSIYFNPQKKAFLGLGPETLSQKLMQQKRWSEGDFQIIFSRYSPCLGYGKISLGLQLGYCYFCLWAVNCLPILYYSLIPSLNLLRNVSLFPKFSSMWSIPFAYVILSQYMYSLVEFLWCNGTVKGWWNYQRLWLYERTASYLFGFVNAILKLLGFQDSPFVITAKVSDRDVAERYKRELMEFGDSSEPMMTILAASALINLFCLIGSVMKIATEEGIEGIDGYLWQIFLCFCVVLINTPLYEGLFLRKDSGRVPYSASMKSAVLALSVCTCSMFLYC